MQLQSTHPQIYSTRSRIRIWNPIGGLWWSFSAETNIVLSPLLSRFCTEAPSLMFGRILNVTFSEELSATGVTQGNFELTMPPDSLDSHQTQEQ